MDIHLIITVMGEDQPGLVESVASAIASHGGNWLESRMSHLGGKFAGVLRVAVKEADKQALINSLQGLEEAGLSVVIRSESAQLVSPKFTRVTLNLIGSDQVGIVSRISGLLARLGVNVEELQTELTTAPMSAELLFMANAQLRLPGDLDSETLREELEAVASDLMVDLRLQQELLG